MTRLRVRSCDPTPLPSDGFRYVQIVGFPGVPGEEALTAHFIHSAVPQSGEFISSSPLLNAIQHATRFASWSNLMDIPTDCPQRERFGWLGARCQRAVRWWSIKQWCFVLPVPCPLTPPPSPSR